MALNCNTCDHKKNAASDGHCSEFYHIPSLDACAMHTGEAVAAAVAAKPSGTFLWLNQPHTSAKEATPTPSVLN